MLVRSTLTRHRHFSEEVIVDLSILTHHPQDLVGEDLAWAAFREHQICS